MIEIKYRRFVTRELRALIPESSFASRIVRALGLELSGTLEALEEEEGDEYWELFPAQGLFQLLADGWNLDHEWFQWTDGGYRDDAGNVIPESVPKTYSASEQMAAYGLLMVNEGIETYGPIPESGNNEEGWSRDWVIEQRADYLLLAYQALVFAQKLALGIGSGGPITPDEIGKAERVKAARKAADALHSKPGGNREKRDKIRAIWLTGKFSSRDVCAEQECSALGMSFSSARKALRGTPEPL